MKPSSGHVQEDVAPPGGTVPAPVQISTMLPQPRPALKPETYSVVVNNVSVQELLFALARDAKLIELGGGTTEMQILTIARELLRGASTRE